MNFSKYKFQKYLTEGQAASAGAQSAIDAEMTSGEKSAEKSLTRPERKSMTDRSQGDKMSQKSNRAKSGTSFPESKEYFKTLRTEKEFVRMLESSRVDWRQDLQEKVVDGQEREQHPYVTVMPTGDENLLQAMTQMVKTAKKKKEAVSEEYLTELKKEKEKESPIRTGEVRRRASKIAQTDRKRKNIRRGVLQTSKRIKRLEDEGQKDRADRLRNQNEAGVKKAQSAEQELHQLVPQNTEKYSETRDGRVHRKRSYYNALGTEGGRRDLARERMSQVGEGFDPELNEAKKKCKDGYKYDSEKKKCVKKKKSSSSTTKVYVVGRPIYGGGGHHHHHGGGHGGNGGDSGGDGGDSGGGDSGGVEEVFNSLGDMLFKEMSGADAIQNVLAKSGKDVNDNLENTEADTKTKNKKKFQKKLENKRLNK